MMEHKTNPAPTVQPSRFDLYHFLFKRVPQLYRREDAVLHCLILFGIIGTWLVYLANYLGHNYNVSQFGLGFKLINSVPGIILVWLLGYSIFTRLPRSSLFLRTFATTWAFLLVEYFSCASLLTTPFPIIDSYLLKFDQALGFSTIGLMQWTHAHPLLHSLLRSSYDTWIFQITLTPLVLALLNKRKEIDFYLIAMYIAMFAAGIIYYFFPTIAPAGVLKSSYFVQNQHDLVTRFNEIHQHLRVTVFDGGLIAFPSCHVLSALFVLYAFRRNIIIFTIMLVVNILLIFATMALGYHYLADVLASAIIFVLIVWLLHKLKPYWQTSTR